MARKTLNERMAETEAEIQQLKEQKALLQKQIRERARKERNHRLIQIGAIMSRLGVDTIEKAQALQRSIDNTAQIHDWLRKVVARPEDQHGAPE